jgi:hypothetical protein
MISAMGQEIKIIEAMNNGARNFHRPNLSVRTMF